LKAKRLQQPCFCAAASNASKERDVDPLIVCAGVAEESARFRLARMHEKLSQLERKMVNVEARLSLHDSSLPDIASVVG
jgi:predicted nucleotidyltransferase